MLEVLMTWIKVNEIRTEQTPGDWALIGNQREDSEYKLLFLEV
jgi:hypothetical protein